MSKPESHRRLTAACKFELYLATRSPESPLGEILRQQHHDVVVADDGASGLARCRLHDTGNQWHALDRE